MVEPGEVVAQTASEDPEVGLRGVASLRALLEAVEELQVRRARELGWSWQQIAALLGVSKQAVHQKYGKGERRKRREAAMRLLPRRRPGPRAKTARPAEPYLAAGAEQARRLGHSYVGTEHVLLVPIRNPDGGATALLRQLGVSTDTVEERLAPG